MYFNVFLATNAAKPQLEERARYKEKPNKFQTVLGEQPEQVHPEKEPSQEIKCPKQATTG